MTDEDWVGVGGRRVPISFGSYTLGVVSRPPWGDYVPTGLIELWVRVPSDHDPRNDPLHTPDVLTTVRVESPHHKPEDLHPLQPTISTVSPPPYRTYLRPPSRYDRSLAVRHRESNSPGTSPRSRVPTFSESLGVHNSDFLVPFLESPGPQVRESPRDLNAGKSTVSPGVGDRLRSRETSKSEVSSPTHTEERQVKNPYPSPKASLGRS